MVRGSGLDGTVSWDMGSVLASPGRAGLAQGGPGWLREGRAGPGKAGPGTPWEGLLLRAAIMERSEWLCHKSVMSFIYINAATFT